MPHSPCLIGTIPDDMAQNYEKVIWSMNYIMQEDARRRFVYGFTIENVSMRLWFCSRSEVLVTKDFNFMKVRWSPLRFYFQGAEVSSGLQHSC